MNKTQKHKYYLCTQDIHAGQALNYICFQENCRNKGLICSMCKTQNHQNHKILPLKKYLQQTRQKIEKKPEVQSSLKLLQELQKIKDGMLYCLEQTVQEISNYIRDCESNIIKKCNEAKKLLQEKLKFSIQSNKIIQKLSNSEYSDVAEAQLNLFNIIQNIKQQKKDPLNIKNQLKSIVTNFTKKYSDFQINMKLMAEDTKSLLGIFQQKNQYQNEPKKLITQSSIKSSNLLTFNFKNKGKSIKLLNKNYEAKQTQNSLSRFVFVTGDSLGFAKKSKITFKINSLVNWIGIGIGLFDVIKNKNYSFDHNKIGHGSYLLSSNGYIWSHSQQSQNVRNKSVLFKIGQYIEVQFNEPYKSVKIKNMNSGLQVELSTVKLTKQQVQNLYFCVNLCSMGDSVQIIDNLI